MSLSVACSSCGAKLRAPDNAVGRAFKCPKCGNQISVAAAFSPRPEQPRSLQVAEDADDLSIKRQRDPADEGIAASKLPLGFGIASLALSIIGMVISVFPCVGMIGIPLSALGLLLGIVGAVFALIRQGRGIGFPLAGSITGFTGLCIAIMWLTVCSGIFSSGGRTVQDAANRIEQKEKEAGARKNWADAIKPVEQERKDKDAPGKQPDVPKKDFQPPPPKPPANKPLKVIHIDSFLGISSDFKACAMSDANGVKIIDLETAENLPAPKWDRDWGHPFSAVFSQDAVAVKVGEKFFGNSRNVRIFSRKTGELKHNVKIPGNTPGLIERIAITSDGKFLVAELQGLFGGPRLVLRDVQQKKTIDELDLNEVPEANHLVRRLDTFPTLSRKPILGYESYKGNNHQIFTVEVEAGKLVKKFKLGNYHEMKGIGKDSMLRAISPAGDLIACTTQDDDIVLYDIVNKKVVHKLKGHLDSVRAVAFSPNGEIVASAATDKTIRFWDVKQGKEVHVIKGVRADAKEFIFSPDGNWIAIVYYTSPPFAEIRSVELK
jgi:hypothetical protein